MQLDRKKAAALKNSDKTTAPHVTQRALSNLDCGTKKVKHFWREKYKIEIDSLALCVI